MSASLQCAYTIVFKNKFITNVTKHKLKMTLKLNIKFLAVHKKFLKRMNWNLKIIKLFVIVKFL